jgi:hypothetical protein
MSQMTGVALVPLSCTDLRRRLAAHGQPELAAWLHSALSQHLQRPRSLTRPPRHNAPRVPHLSVDVPSEPCDDDFAALEGVLHLNPGRGARGYGGFRAARGAARGKPRDRTSRCAKSHATPHAVDARTCGPRRGP